MGRLANPNPNPSLNPNAGPNPDPDPNPNPDPDPNPNPNANPNPDQEIDDTMTAERVMLLDAIVAGDLDGIRASTKINWNFVYPPAYTDPDSGEKCLEAWCRTPLCLLVRPDEGN